MTTGSLFRDLVPDDASLLGFFLTNRRGLVRDLIFLLQLDNELRGFLRHGLQFGLIVYDNLLDFRHLLVGFRKRFQPDDVFFDLYGQVVLLELHEFDVQFH